MKVEGKAVVTGASRGLGRAVALELAARGFDVVATMRNPDAGADLPGQAEEADSPGSITIETLDVTDAGGFTFPADTKVLVNNAGLRLGYWPVEYQAAEDSGWRETFEANVFGLVEVTAKAIPVMRAGGGGVICNVSSASILGAMPFMSTYRASKAAVSAICESLAFELAPFGIRVLEVLPGPIGTELMYESIMFRKPDAIQLAEYTAMASADIFGGGDESRVTRPADAARSIVDDILDDDAPLRVGCDPVSEAILESWRNSSDIERLAGTRATFGLQD